MAMMMAARRQLQRRRDDNNDDGNDDDDDNDNDDNNDKDVKDYDDGNGNGDSATGDGIRRRWQRQWRGHDGQKDTMKMATTMAGAQGATGYNDDGDNDGGG